MKNNTNPLWTSLYSSPCDYDTGPLKAAIFTTFEPPDATFLAEDFLPEILRLDRRLSDDSNEYFWAELYDKLKRSNIAIISSFGKEISNSYREIWRYIKKYSTGCDNKAIQHAKLWLIHREGIDNNGFGTLEMHVSSSNLTKSAFEKQIQSAWRIVIPLSGERKDSNRESWGILPHFLEELSRSCGNCELIDYFQDLLEKAKAPNDVTFLASVPGTHSRKKPWGSHGLSKLKLSKRGKPKIRVLVPYVGNMTQKDLEYWTGEIDGKPDDLTLLWIDKNPTWGINWKMQTKTFKNLYDNHVKIVKFNSIVHVEQKLEEDKRWSHSKIYEIQKGNSKKIIIITSANFSPSAWGKRVKNGIQINNFEFGVAMTISKKSNWSLIEKSDGLLKQKDAYLSDDLKEAPDNGLVWASAEWDGNKINVKARMNPNNEHPNRNIIIFCEKNLRIKISKRWRKEGNLWEWSTKWGPNQNGIPNYISIKYNSQTSKIPLIDSRQYEEKELDPIPDVNPEMALDLKYSLLFERYGGQFVNDIDEIPEYGDSERRNSHDVQNNGINDYEGDYSLSWLVQARKWFVIVDNWTKKYNTPSNEIETDGKNFIQYFRSQRTDNIGISKAAKVVAEEFDMRIKMGRGKGDD